MEFEIITKNNEWNNVIERFQNSTIYHTSSWKELLEKHGCKGFLIVAKDEDSITGILPIFIKKSKYLHFKQFESIPFCDQDGLLIYNKNEDTLKVLLDGWRQLIENHSPSGSIIRASNILDLKCYVIPAYRYIFNNNNYTLNQVLINFYDNKIPRYVRKAISKNVKVTISEGIPFFNEYYDMYKEVMKRRKILLPSFSKQFLKDVFKILKKNTKIFLVKREDEILSSAISFHYNNALYNWSLVSHTDALKYNANDLKHWEAIKWAIENGCKYIEFGTVPIGEEGLHNIKKRYSTNYNKTYTLEISHNWLADLENFMISTGKNIISRFS